MKRAITVFVILISCSSYAGAQTFSEWFRQKKTQKKYLVDQIAALKVYSSYLRKGYDISQKGLDMIGDLKDGDFKMHADYFNKLKSVNPAVSSSPKVQDIIRLQEQIRSSADKARHLLRSSAAFSINEVSYLKQVYERLNKDCLATTTELERVISPGELQMKDDERLQRINRLYDESLSQYRFAMSLGNSIVQLIKQKDQQQSEIKNLRTWYGIKKD